ncbi:hypothetical protein NP493_998g00042 [Ridgeia piscesae]|uniref:Uncharacterized protein n=1 Tax=Ridgeia piscesae TaxID=27915 RepID=A0AAD9KI43_RIDPI|nr:hypothetical protein NP493_998g00042 [Ridgeia piscesae]
MIGRGKVQIYKIQLELCKMHHSCVVVLFQRQVCGSDCTRAPLLAACKHFMHQNLLVQILSHFTVITINLHSIYKHHNIARRQFLINLNHDYISISSKYYTGSAPILHHILNSSSHL